MADARQQRIDDAVLALLLLGRHEGQRVWKSFDWEVLNRLHEQGFMSNPVGKTHSVQMTPEGLARAEALFEALFGGTPPPAAAQPSGSER